MAYVITTARAGTQPIATTSTVKNHALGTVVHAVDPTYGEGEFIYLQGIGSTVVGSVVSYDVSTYITALAPVGTAIPRAIAFAMSANVASSYGWYQIGGVAVAKKALATSLATGVAVAVKTIGLISATGSLKEVSGAVTCLVSSAKSASSLTTVQLMINRPRMQGRIT